MAAKVNWKIWRDQFVQGPDDLDYKRLSKYTGVFTPESSELWSQQYL